MRSTLRCLVCRTLRHAMVSLYPDFTQDKARMGLQVLRVRCHTKIEPLGAGGPDGWLKTCKHHLAILTHPKDRCASRCGVSVQTSVCFVQHLHLQPLYTPRARSFVHQRLLCASGEATACGVNLYADMVPPPVQQHGQSQKNNGHTGSSCLDKPVLACDAQHKKTLHIENLPVFHTILTNMALKHDM